MAVEILNESGIEVPEDALLRMARHVYARLHVHERAETAVTVVDAARMAELHEEWMDLPGPTDVMSLPMDELTPGSPEAPAEGVLGDVVLCPEVAAEQARSMAEVALAWTVAQPGVASVLVGASRAAQLQQNITALDITLSADQQQRLDEASRPPALNPYFIFQLPARMRFGVEHAVGWSPRP